jgi:glycosyltransferase involved in cell wall biosynthesis
VPAEHEPGSADDHAVCAVISGNGQHDADYEALFAALATVVRAHPTTQFFLDGQGSDQHRLWQMARRRRLLTNMSLIPHKLGQRELMLGADFLIHPQQLGRSRSLLLQAMAHAMPVLARSDIWVDYLVDNQTAWVVDQPGPGPWQRLIRKVIEDRPAASQLGQTARDWVPKRHVASNQVQATLDLYAKVTGEPMKFPGQEQE